MTTLLSDHQLHVQTRVRDSRYSTYIKYISVCVLRAGYPEFPISLKYSVLVSRKSKLCQYFCSEPLFFEYKLPLLVALTHRYPELP